MQQTSNSTYIDTIVIGGGQAGLCTGYYLQKRGVPFLILDANERVGDVWRNRWDSLKLFSPSRYVLPGLALRAHRVKGIVASELTGSPRHVYAATYGEPPDPPATAALLAALAEAAELS